MGAEFACGGLPASNHLPSNIHHHPFLEALMSFKRAESQTTRFELHTLRTWPNATSMLRPSAVAEEEDFCGTLAIAGASCYEHAAL